MIINEFLRHFVCIFVIAVFQRQRLQAGGRFDLHWDFMDFVGTSEHLTDFDPRGARSLIIMTHLRLDAPSEHITLLLPTEHFDLSIARPCLRHMLNAYLGTARGAGNPPDCPHSPQFSYS